MDEQPDTPDPDEAPEAEDEESQIDGCEVKIENATSDEDLPPTEGGVA